MKPIFKLDAAGGGLGLGIGGTDWNPKNISGLVMQLDPLAANSLYTDVARTTLAGAGDTVACVADQSGLGNHATQVTAAARPYMRTGLIKSNLGVSLDALDNRALDCPAIFSASATACTLVIPARLTQLVAQGYLWAINNQTIAIYEDLSTHTWQVMANGSAYGSGIALDFNPHVICLRWDNVTISLDVDDQHYSHAAVIGAKNLSVYNTIGARNITGTYFYQELYRMYGALAYNRAITDAELLQIRSYYAQKLGFPFGAYYTAVALGTGTNGKCWQPQMVRLASGRLFAVFTE